MASTSSPPRESPKDESFPANPSHHVGNPQTHFQNPWPSFSQPAGRLDLFKARFGINRERNFVPVPEDRNELVKVRAPDWGRELDPQGVKLKATWIGHASWYVETPVSSRETHQEAATAVAAPDRPEGTEDTASPEKRGVNILLDPLFSDRTSPFSFFGPKRYTPTPCTIADLPEVDVVLTSHNHYDHLDLETIKALNARSSRTHFLCGLGNKEWFVAQGIDADRVTELDWWQAVDVHVPFVGDVRLVCTPAQHFSARSPFDAGKTLWCSWALGEVPSHEDVPMSSDADTAITARPFALPSTIPPAPSPPILACPSLYFAGDTGYRTVPTPSPTPAEAAKYPFCPAFSTIGSLLGPFSLALLPIGLCTPRDLMSNVHCCPEDAVDVAKDVGAAYTVGMHYGTVRGGISAQYEDVRDPPRRFQAACEEAGLVWGKMAGLCDVGETVVVS